MQNLKPTSQHERYFKSLRPQSQKYNQPSFELHEQLPLPGVSSVIPCYPLCNLNGFALCFGEFHHAFSISTKPVFLFPSDSCYGEV